MPAIPTHNHEGVCSYFEANVERPGWRPWLKSIDSTPAPPTVPIHGVPIKLGSIGTVFRNATTESRVAYATYHWLDPKPTPRPLSMLGNLIQMAGLGHLDAKAVVEKMKARAKEIERKHPPLEMWIRMRLALLDFAAGAKPALSADLKDALLGLRNTLIRVNHLVWFAPAECEKLADDVSKRAMRGAATAAHAELSDGPGGTLNASLMVPVSNPETAAASLVPAGLAAGGVARASELWQHLPGDPTTYLMVVGETDARHLGFYTPVVVGDGQTHLPGAPQAFALRRGSTVFKADVPPLVGFGDNLSLAWQTYISQRVTGRHFVSLPFEVPRQDAALGKVVLAVLNVNADVAAGSEWYRAYHQEWLDRAKEAVAPFVEIAYYAFQAKQVAHASLTGCTELQLDIDEPAWQRLPGVPELAETPRLVEGDRPPPQLGEGRRSER